MGVKKIIIISPSGNLYGSEQVLLDYLYQTSLSGLLYVPENSEFHKKLVESKFENFQIKGYNRNTILSLYLSISRTLTTGKYTGVYLNEAGHIKYFGLMKIFFPYISFVIHVRLIEDTSPERWLAVYKNRLNAISTSKYIQNLLPVPSRMIYDPFKFRPKERYSKPSLTTSVFNVGIIGRVTSTKGSYRLPAIIEKLTILGEIKHYHFHFFGDIYQEFIESGLVKLLSDTGVVSFHGFVSDKSMVYGELQAVLHLSEQEALGRIFLEALDEEIPFIGLNGGGIGEMACMLGMKDFVVEMSTDCISDQVATKLIFLKENFGQVKSDICKYKAKARLIFEPSIYSHQLDSCF